LLANGSLIACAFDLAEVLLTGVLLTGVLLAGFLPTALAPALAVGFFAAVAFPAGLPLVPVALAAGLPLVVGFCAFIFTPLYFDLSGDISSR
jgi:hypothetical protein